jgi:glycerol-3-phosphate dehydrogenase
LCLFNFQGVRYLQTAFSLDPSAKRRECFELVKESTEERENLINNAPHLTRYLATVIPCKNIFYAVYYFVR